MHEAPKTNNRGRLWLMSYYVKRKDLGYGQNAMGKKGDRVFSSQVHKIRDGLPAVELTTTLCTRLGFGWGGALLQVPKAIQKVDWPITGPIQEDTEYLKNISERDIVLLPTRPPVLDEDNKGQGRLGAKREAIERSGSQVETLVLDSLKSFFGELRRNMAVLHPDLKLTEVNSWPAEGQVLTSREPKSEELASMNRFTRIHFRVSQGARISELGDTSPNERNYTVGYLIAAPRVGGTTTFRLLNVFGMGGTETAWTAFMLRTSHYSLLERAVECTEPTLWMIPFVVPERAPYPFFTAKPESLKPKDEWEHVICWKLSDPRLVETAT